ncbi:MAG: hypothetical protein R3293_13085, partial [Candidatus Promineifilaceae bacterium]|nr:hypothetical protein [Candidatus Promineifilaceae bacterium]
ENSLMVIMVYALRYQPWTNSGLVQSPALVNGSLMVSILFFMMGLVLAAAILYLAGFLVVIRYDSINEYLLPSIAITSLLMLPLVAYLAGWQSPLLYLHPLQASLLILEAAWQSQPAVQLLYALTYDLLWIWLLFHAARRAFYQFVIVKQGVAK